MVSARTRNRRWTLREASTRKTRQRRTLKKHNPWAVLKYLCWSLFAADVKTGTACANVWDAARGASREATRPWREQRIEAGRKGGREAAFEKRR